MAAGIARGFGVSPALGMGHPPSRAPDVTCGPPGFGYGPGTSQAMNQTFGASAPYVDGNPHGPSRLMLGGMVWGDRNVFPVILQTPLPASCLPACLPLSCSTSCSSSLCISLLS